MYICVYDVTVLLENLYSVPLEYQFTNTLMLSSKITQLTLLAKRFYNEWVLVWGSDWSNFLVLFKQT